eukprot:scaffold2044_cov202-Prasinococcus_capsulatus_cf.AAC.7
MNRRKVKCSCLFRGRPLIPQGLAALLKRAARCQGPPRVRTRMVPKVTPTSGRIPQQLSICRIFVRNLGWKHRRNQHPAFLGPTHAWRA